MKIYLRTKLKDTENNIYEVIGYTHLRKNYFYMLKNQRGEKSSIKRTSLLEAIENKILHFI